MHVQCFATLIVHQCTAPTAHCRFVLCPFGGWGWDKTLVGEYNFWWGFTGRTRPSAGLARTGQVLPSTAMLWRAMLGIYYSSKCLEFNAPLDMWRARILPMPTPIADCCFRIGGCPVLWPAWLSFSIENADWNGPLGRLGSLAAGLHTLMVPWYGLQPGGASWPGPVCPFR